MIDFARSQAERGQRQKLASPENRANPRRPLIEVVGFRLCLGPSPAPYGSNLAGKAMPRAQAPGVIETPVGTVEAFS